MIKTVRFFLLPLSLVALFSSCKREPAQRDQVTELRGVWLTNVDSHVLESRTGIAEAMQFLADHNFNVVFPVVWNKGFTLYRSAVMDSLFHIPIDTLPAYVGRDPLRELTEEAHKRNIAVIPWFEFGFSSSYQANGGHLLRAKPEWGARDREGNLLTKNGFEWMNPYHPDVQNFMLSLVLEVAKNYAVDGVQGDDRLPAHPIEGGYEPQTQELYRAQHGGTPPPQDFRDTAWHRWRGDILNAFGRRVYDEVKRLKPQLIVSWSPSAYPWGYDEYLQEYPSWVNGGYADLVHPQVYRYTLEEYKRTLDSQANDSVGIRIKRDFMYPGILMKLGNYYIAEDYLLQAIAYNRTRGYHGEVFFFYEGLRWNNGQLAKELKKNAYAHPAKLPFTPAFQIQQ